MWVISVAALVVVIVLCVTGAVHPRFHDNLLQRAGMLLVAVAMWPRMKALIEIEDYGIMMPAWTLIGQHVGLACYALGTTWKVWRHNRTRHAPGDDEPPTGAGALSDAGNHPASWRRGA